jgi:hypothetical protein
MQNKDKIRQSMTQKITYRFFEREVNFSALPRLLLQKISAVAARRGHRDHLGHLFLGACGFP